MLQRAMKQIYTQSCPQHVRQQSLFTQENSKHQVRGPGIGQVSRSVKTLSAFNPNQWYAVCKIERECAPRVTCWEVDKRR